MSQSFKELLAADQLIPTFAVSRIPHPIIIEMFGLAGGYQGFWIDLEHGPLTPADVIPMALAGRANGLDNFVRMPPTGYWQVTQCLEAGAGGVMGAQIQSADHAREFVRWAKFPPAGVRGLNAGGRDCNYTHTPVGEFAQTANDKVFVAIQIETLGALNEADEIAAIDGVDLLFIGPSDLSMALGIVAQFHHDKLWEAIERVAAACRNRGKSWGAVTPDPEFATRAVEAGCRMPTFGNDLLILRRGIESFKAAFGKQFAG